MVQGTQPPHLLTNCVGTRCSHCLGLGSPPIKFRNPSRPTTGQLAKNPVSTSLRFPFACLANKRRKVAITPGFINGRVESWCDVGQEARRAKPSCQAIARLIERYREIHREKTSGVIRPLCGLYADPRIGNCSNYDGGGPVADRWKLGRDS